MSGTERELTDAQWRRVATRYEQREANDLAMVTIAAIGLLWLD